MSILTLTLYKIYSQKLAFLLSLLAMSPEPESIQGKLILAQSYTIDISWVVLV